MRPPDLLRILLNFFGSTTRPVRSAALVRNATGRLTAEEKTFIPETERPKVYRIARIWLAIYVVRDRTAIRRARSGCR